jgi:hypothetical protein
MSPLFPAAYGLIGDQLFAIQGSIAAPIFIAGLQYNEIGSGGSDGNWDGEATTNSTSELPTALTTGDTAVRLINASNEEQDNWQFSCTLAGSTPVSGTPSEIRAILHNRAFWKSDDSSQFLPALEAGCSVMLTPVDNTPPNVSIEQATAQADPTAASPINFTVEFDEPVSGFATGDVTLSGTANPTVDTVTEIAPNDGTTYNVAVSGMTGDGTVIATIGAGVAQDLSGNGNEASTSLDNEVRYDATAPVLLSIERFDPMTSPTNADNLQWALTFSEVVSGSLDVLLGMEVNGGPAPASITVATPDNTGYTYLISGGDLANFNGTVGLDIKPTNNITDTAGNALLVIEPPIDETYILDNSAPTLVSTEPIDDATGVITEPVLTATFSEPVQLASGGEIVIQNLTAGTLFGTIDAASTAITFSGNGFTIDPMAPFVATNEYEVQIDAAALEDAAGNPFAGIVSGGWTFTTAMVDNTPPIAVCQDVTVILDEFGNATVSVTDIDNGSTDNESIVSYGVQRRIPRVFDQNVVPEVIFGSGNANGGFTNNLMGGVELGLRAKVRYPSPSNTFNSNGDGTYSHLAIAGTPASRAGWNFEWSINTDPTGTTGDKLNSLTYEMGIDFDAGLGTDFYVFDPINLPVADHAIGDNGTSNGGGTVAADPVAYVALLAANNVAQNSWNLDFFNELAGKTFDPTVDGTYEVYLKAFDASGAMVGETKIKVIVGEGGSPSPLEQSVPFTEANIGTNLVELTVVDEAGNVSTCTATVTVQPAVEPCSVAFDTHPQSVVLCENEPHTFEVMASGTGTIVYDWQQSTDGGTTWTSNPAYANGGTSRYFGGGFVNISGTQYRVEATSDNGTPNDDTDDCSVISDVAILTINPLPTVTFTALADLAVDAGVQTGLGGGTPLGMNGVFGGGLVAVNPFANSIGSEGLRIIDPNTFIETNALLIDLPGKTVTGANGIGHNPTNGLYYAIVKVQGQPTRSLVTIDITTGIATEIGDTGLRLAGIAFTDAGVLYGISGDGASPSETLYTLDLNTGAPSFVLTLGNGTDGEAIAFNPDDGFLYHMSGLGTQNVDEIFERINLTTLVVTPITLSGFDGSEVLGMSYAGGGNFIVSDLNSQWSSVTTTGVLSPLVTTTSSYRGHANGSGLGTGIYSGPGVSDNADGTYDFDPAAAGVGVHTITYTYTDGNSCTNSASDDVEVKVACEVVIDAQPMDAMICAGEPLSFDVTATGNGVLTYQWQVDTGAGFEDLGAPSASSQLSFAFMEIGGNGNQYRVIATYDNGTPNDDTDDCSATSETAALTVNPAPIVEITGNDSYCNNGNGVVLDAGAEHASYLWSPGGETTQTITALEGSYTVEVTNEYGCKTLSDAFLVTNNQPLVCNILQDVLATNHLTEDGVATVNVTGGTGEFTYLWDNGETTQTANTLTYGMHSVTVTDSNGCETTCQIDIAKELYCWTNLVQNVSVNGGSNGAARVYGNGGYRPHSFEWDDGSTEPLNNNLSAGIHYVTITDATGATSRCSVTISEPTGGNCDTFTVGVVQDVLSTNHLTEDGTATVHPQGGTAPYTYAWDNGETARTATTLTYGLHTVTVTDANGCESSSQIDIAKELYCWINLHANVGVHGGTDGVAKVHGNGGYRPHTFRWDDGSTEALNNNLGVGTHYVTITDATGATSQCSVTISEPNQEVCDGIDNDGDGQIDEGFDQDGDGIADCFDDCDNRIDSDGDGTPDCTDRCDDSIDRDGDGIPDCTDDCDDSIDTDGDGIPDCTDLCDDSIDSDRDGTPDCTDPCDDSIDSDSDGTPDCQDTCPNVAGPLANNGCPDACTLTITGQPVFVDQCLAYGDVASLTVAVNANNEASVNYQWQESVNGGAWSPITSTTTNMLTNIGFDSPNFSGNIAYRVIVVSDNGTPNDITDDCMETSATTTIYSLPVVTSLLPSTIQVDDAPIYLNTGSPVGGSYSGNGVGDDFNGRTIFDPEQAGVGVHTISYTYTNENNCTQVVNNQIEVTAIPGVDCSIVIIDQPEFTESCLAFDDVTSLTVGVVANNGATVGYEWQESINGAPWSPITSATTNMLADIGFDNPTFTGNIAYRVIAVSDNGTPYDITDDCTVTSEEASIYTLPEVTLQLPSDFQVDDAPISLNTGSPMGGTYSGNGVTSDPNGRPIFDPALAGVGMHIITYEYTNAGGCSNTATQEVTVSMVPIPLVVYINEYQPNPDGVDPSTQIIELKGPAGLTFNGWIILVDGDGNASGGVNEAIQVSGTFDGNGLLKVTIDDIENPSHTIIVSERYDSSMTDFDGNNDGQLDAGSTAGLGTIFDALGVPDVQSDEMFLFGEQMGGADFTYTGDEPQLVFRDSQTNGWFAINDHDIPIAHTIAATEIAFDQFFGSLTEPTFGGINPLLAPRSMGLKIEVWPNPSVKTINLQLSKSEKVDSYSIHDMTGKLIRSIKANQSLRQQLDVEDLQSGVYMIRASGTHMTTITQKFIKRN